MFGNFQLILQELQTKNKTISLKEFMQLKPQLTKDILDKVEPVIIKLVEKGQTRHTIVQAILGDYVECETSKEKILNIADTVKEKLPALLSSREGLRVACTFFDILDAKDRKVAVKNLPINEMVVNKIAHLFVIHVANTLDDTQLTKKKVLHEALKVIDDHIEDHFFQSVLISALTLPNSLEKKKDKAGKTFHNPFLSIDDLKCILAGQSYSTSKKDDKVRHGELVKIVQKPLETFFEEKLTYYLQEPKGNMLMKALFIAIAA